jgi:RHS repeat-associated protein
MADHLSPETTKEDLNLTTNQPLDRGKYENQVGKAFEITAQSSTSKAEVNQFPQEITLIYRYDEKEFAAAPEDLVITYYDETLQDWVPLQTLADNTGQTLTAFTNHFTVFNIDTANYQAGHLPTVDSFQTSLFTGAATYSYPIQLPAGPGGQQPSLNLTYNSQVVDQASRLTQASWVGMGWSLETPFIERNINGSKDVSNDIFMLTMDGISSTLVSDVTNNGDYHTTDESFYRIHFDTTNDSWQIWDKAGNEYFFEQTAQFLYPHKCANPSYFTYDNLTWHWSLMRVKNVFGNEITYTYQAETVTYHFTSCNGNSGHRYPVVAIYPDTITYANNRYRVKFERAADRLDYVPGYYTGNWGTAFMRSRLTDIRVEQDANGDGTFETMVRKYTLTYETNLNLQIMPGLDWGASGVNDWHDHTLTLKQVQEFGSGGSVSLPALTFEYGDGLHLTNADNGYGGAVEFTYDNWSYANPDPALDSNVEDRLMKHSFGDGGYCDYIAKTKSQGTNPEWAGYNGPPNYAYCYYETLRVLHSPWYQEATAYNNQQFYYLYKPGNSYRAYITGSTTSPRVGTQNPIGTIFKLGHYDGTTFYESTNSGTPGSTPTNLEYVFTLNPTATLLYPTIITDSLMVHSYKLEMLPTFYRVTAKTVSDGQGNQYDYTYDYTNPAVNDSDHSDWVDTTNPLVKKYSEFRGHSQVTEHAPGGKTTVTTFEQGDILKGRATQVDVKDNSNNLFTSSITSYEVQNIPEGYTVGTDQKINWIKTISQENQQHNGNAGYRATKDSYTYDNYGNLTGSTTATWDGSAWNNYRKQATLFYPNTTGWLVGLPAGSELYSCSGGTCSTLEAASYNLYDNNSTYNTAPTTGKLKAQRTWVNGNDYSQTSTDYDAWGNQTSVTSWSGYGTLTSAPSSGARTTNTAYDTTYHSYPLSSTNPLNQTTGWTYDYTLGVPLTETDINGNVTSAGYDTFGRLTTLTRPLDSSPTITIAYHDSAPFYTTATQRIDGTQNFSVQQTYDGMGRKIETRTIGAQVLGITGTTDIVTHFGYNAFGQVTSQSTPHAGGETSYNTTTSYDILGRPLTINNPDGTSVSSTYDDYSTIATDALNRTTTNTLDALGRTISVAPPEGPGVSYAYDAKDQLIQAVYGAATTSIQYDRAGRKLSMQDADMGSWSYAYDALGNLSTQTDARGCITTLAYDNLNRLTGKTYGGTNCPATTAVNFAYDEDNQLGYRTSMSYGTDNTSWAYDERGRVTSETKVILGQPFTTGWTYNSADLPVTMTYPDDEEVTSTYLPQMALDTLTGDGGYITDSQYDSAGRLRSQSFGNGVTQAHTYNNWNTQGGRLQEITAGTLQDLSYSYDAVGNILSIVDDKDGPQTQAFTYDTLDRLTSAEATGGQNGVYAAETYGYDEDTGNLALKSGLSYSYLDSAHAHAVTNTSDGSVYTYDANGNQISRLKGGVTTIFTYNAENKLIQVNIGGTPTASFVYDGDGNRVASTINGVTSRFVGEYYEVTDEVVTKYYGGKTAMWTTTGSLTYLLADHLGSNSLFTSDSGTLLSETRYKPWGEIRYSTGTTTTPYSYTGQYSNTADFGWMYYKARWYDNSLGRFAQPDSIIPEAGDPRAWDRYSYVKNNPIMYNDPSGHCIDGATTAICIAMAAGAIASYAIQVGDNRSKGMDWGAALTTNISGEKILAGALIGGGVILAAAAAAVGLSAIGITVGAACADGDCKNEVEATGTALNAIRNMKGSEKGITYENWLKTTTGGEGSFTLEGSQFDNKVGNVLMEAKSYDWNGFNLSEFQNQVGKETAIATRNGYQYVLHLLNKPPQSVTNWLIKKGIDYIIESGAK